MAKQLLKKQHHFISLQMHMCLCFICLRDRNRQIQMEYTRPLHNRIRVVFLVPLLLHVSGALQRQKAETTKQLSWS